MELAAALGRVIPFAFASGLNLYATVAVLGLTYRYGLVDLPEHFRAFGNPVVIGGALALYLVEFVADKIPWLDSLWDALHTVVRPLGGALVAVTALGAGSVEAQLGAAALGGVVALTTHLTKAGTRAAVNASPEPLSNWFLSLGEDVLAVGLVYLAVEHPVLALGVTLVLLASIGVFAAVLIRALMRRFGRHGRQVREGR
jgi:hypothetical protein